MQDLVGSIIAYEEGGLTAHETVDLFSDLVRTGTAWSLQGSYGRTAAAMIEDGILDADGNIDDERLEEVLESC